MDVCYLYIWFRLKFENFFLFPHNSNFKTKMNQMSHWDDDKLMKKKLSIQNTHTHTHILFANKNRLFLLKSSIWLWWFNNNDIDS